VLAEPSAYSASRQVQRGRHAFIAIVLEATASANQVSAYSTCPFVQLKVADPFLPMVPETTARC
jgi:hypothetical protein